MNNTRVIAKYDIDGKTTKGEVIKKNSKTIVVIAEKQTYYNKFIDTGKSFYNPFFRKMMPLKRKIKRKGPILKKHIKRHIEKHNVKFL
jgi:hypothetical protein